MSTLDRITNLLKEQNKKQKELTDYLGITKNAFTDWKNGRIKSYNKYIPQIAEFLNVSIDFLLTGNEHEKELPESEKLENCVVFHRDGKTSVKALTAAQVKAIEKLIDSMDGDTPEYL